MKYFFFSSTSPEGIEVTIILREDGAQIPMNEANPDYRQYLAWVAEGNTAEPWTEPTE